MPYIKRERRKIFDAHLETCAQEIEGEGELNYCITCRSLDADSAVDMLPGRWAKTSLHTKLRHDEGPDDGCGTHILLGSGP
jgi:hypothetical protein